MKFIVLSIALVMAAVGITVYLNPFAPGPAWENLKGSVRIQQEKGQYRIWRNGAPFDLKGAAVTDIHLLRSVKESGGTAVRVYDIQHAGQWLDSAASYGLSVILALPVQQQGNGIDYADKSAVAAQRAQVETLIRKYRNHPALLMWVIANEPTIFVAPEYSNLFQLRRILKSVDELAQLVHELDPNHPAVLVHAGFFSKLLKMTQRFCPNVDLVCFNSFSSVSNFMRKLEKIGWNQPFFFSEFGSRGYWSWEETEWLSRQEPTSYQKALYLQSQFEGIAASKGRCLGGFVFLWGMKNEYTPTAFSLFAPGAPYRETELVDVCRKAWKGTVPHCASPSIASVRLNNQQENVYLAPGAPVDVQFDWVGNPSDSLKVSWELQAENGEYLLSSYKAQGRDIIQTGSFTLAASQNGLKTASNISGTDFSVTAPKQTGPYRLFFYVENACHKVATANAGFFVQPH